jgi:hypothetical protein
VQIYLDRSCGEVLRQLEVRGGRLETLAVDQLDLEHAALKVVSVAANRRIGIGRIHEAQDVTAGRGEPTARSSR